jgi:hypothetical protein
MPKNKLSEYSSTAGDNTDIGGINIAEGMAPSDVNNAMREQMSQLKEFIDGSSGDTITTAKIVATTAEILSGASVTGTATFNSAVVMSGESTLSGGSLLKRVKETTTVSATAAANTINYDFITQSVLYYTSDATGNWVLNVRGDSGTTLNSVMSTGQSATVAFLATQGSTAYYQTALQVDGSSVTPKWQGGSAPTEGNASSVDAYVFTIIKTADATFTALGSQTQFA